MAIFDPQHFDFGPDGNLYVAAEFTSRVLRYNGSTGAFIDVFASGGAPSGLTFGPDHHLYVGTGNEIRRYDIATSSLIDVFVSWGSGGLSIPVGIVFGPDGNLYAASAGTGEILRYDGRTGKFIDAFVASGRGGLTGPRMIAFKPTMTVCHKTSGSRSNSKTITVQYLSSFDHVRHGDAIGACR